jgi:hypothetical protein
VHFTGLKTLNVPIYRYSTKIGMKCKIPSINGKSPKNSLPKKGVFHRYKNEVLVHCFLFSSINLDNYLVFAMVWWLFAQLQPILLRMFRQGTFKMKTIPKLCDPFLKIGSIPYTTYRKTIVFAQVNDIQFSFIQH